MPVALNHPESVYHRISSRSFLLPGEQEDGSVLAWYCVDLPKDVPRDVADNMYRVLNGLK